MWAPAVLPVEITFFIMLALLVGLPFLFKRFTKHPVLVAFGTCAVASIPALLAVGMVVDSVRYGEFTYSSSDELGQYTFWTLPDTATDITMHKYASGHEVKFRTTKVELERWMSRMHARRMEYSPDTKPFSIDTSVGAEWFDSDFSRHNWTFPADAINYRGPIGADGSGFDVWYSNENETAYISAAYW